VSALTAKYGGIPLWGYLAGGVVGLGALLYLRRGKTAAATSPASSTASTGSGNTEAYTGTGSSGPGDSDAIAAILAAQSAAGATGSSSTAAYSPPTGESLQGSGYYVPSSTAPIESANQQQYQWISSWASAQPLINGGQTLYYQPTPGIFAPATQNNALISGLGASTPLFAQVSSSS
jgi:hypothetical protein